MRAADLARLKASAEAHYATYPYLESAGGGDFDSLDMVELIDHQQALERVWAAARSLRSIGLLGLLLREVKNESEYDLVSQFLTALASVPEWKL